MKTTQRNLWLKVGVNLLVLAVIVLIILLTRSTAGTVGEEYVPGVFASAWSLLPPVVAIVLALITKEVYSALFVGITIGAFLYAGGNAELALNTMLYHQSGGLVPGIADIDHAGILVFVVMLATLVVLMNKSGGAAAFGRWAQRHIKSRVGAELITVVLGMLIFVDDGFNCMTVGSVMRPVTDSHRVSRAKLAFLIDSTAAPICIIAPISCWAAAVSYAVPEDVDINGFSMFLHTIPYNLYALGTITLVIALILARFDYGPMRRHEENAAAGDLFSGGDQPYTEEYKTDHPDDGKVSNLVLPVIALIVCCILGMLYTGGFFSGVGLIEAFSNAESARGLVMGSLVAMLLTFWLYMNRRVVSFSEFMGSFAAGFRTMCAPMIILILSWNLSGVTRLLGAADFIHGVMESTASSVQMFVPVIVFLVSVFLAFSTGTSWGTFTILIPIVCAVFPPSTEMLAISISACLAGAVCGDHCSPISDTTIMSSAGAGCNHINHVSTQLPYAMTTAGFAAVGYLVAGIIGYYADSAVAMLATPLTLVLIVMGILIARRLTNRAA